EAAGSDDRLAGPGDVASLLSRIDVHQRGHGLSVESEHVQEHDALGAATPDDASAAPDEGSHALPPLRTPRAPAHPEALDIGVEAVHRLPAHQRRRTTRARARRDPLVLAPERRLAVVDREAATLEEMGQRRPGEVRAVLVADVPEGAMLDDPLHPRRLEPDQRIGAIVHRRPDGVEERDGPGDVLDDVTGAYQVCLHLHTRGRKALSKE